jgi:hypothetical protein
VILPFLFFCLFSTFFSLFSRPTSCGHCTMCFLCFLPYLLTLFHQSFYTLLPFPSTVLYVYILKLGPPVSPACPLVFSFLPSSPTFSLSLPLICYLLCYFILSQSSQVQLRGFPRASHNTLYLKICCKLLDVNPILNLQLKPYLSFAGACKVPVARALCHT